MILPVGDAPNPPGTPLVTYLLIGANVAVYLLTLPLTWQAPNPTDPQLAEYVHLVARQTGYRMSVPEILAGVSLYDMLVFRWGYRPVDPSLLDLLVSMFLHGGLAHLVGNMLFLWIYGDNVEHRLGRARYLLSYLGCGAVATLSHAMFFPTSGLPLVGASGAISGVLGFYFVWFPRNRVHLLLLFPFLVRLEVSARALLGFYLVVENLFPFLLSGGAGGVAHSAHIGGFVSGFALAHWIDRRGLAVEPVEYAGARSAADPAEVRAAITDGRFADAARAYFALADRGEGALRPQESILLGNWLLENGHPRGALVVFRRHLRDFPNGPGAAEAHLGAGLVQLRELDQPTAAYQHFLDGLDLDPPPAVELALRQALQTIQARQLRTRPTRIAPGSKVAS